MSDKLIPHVDEDGSAYFECELLAEAVSSASELEQSGPEVENKQLSLWDLCLLEMYGKNNNSNRKSIFRHIAGLAGNPSQLPAVAAASNSYRRKPPI